MKIKTMIMIAEQQTWHFMTGPIKSSPFQFRMIYPMITPMMPQRAVEAPALTPSLWIATLNMLAPMPERMQMMKALSGPSVYSTLDRKRKVTSTLPKMCRKLICKNIAESNRYTSPFLIPGAQIAPVSIRACVLTCSRLLEALSKPFVSYTINMTTSARIIRNVIEKKEKLGQSPKTSISQQFSSLGFLTLLCPETKSTR